METCDRCSELITGKSFTGRRKDGSPAILCATCMAELKKGSKQENLSKESSMSSTNETRQRKTKKSGDTWYHHIGWGALCLVFAILVAYQLNGLESGGVSSVRVWWPVAILYRTLGFWGAVSCPGIIAFLFFGWGVKELISEEADKK